MAVWQSYHCRPSLLDGLVLRNAVLVSCRCKATRTGLGESY